MRSRGAADRKRRELAGDHINRVSRLTLLQFFTYAKDGRQSGTQQCSHLASGLLVGLGKYVPAF